ncbi:YidC/Oxa1 family membrane protein insertase [Tepidiforma sp.]|uniref:YidC/Oxa1 family membrane protein insertase n=1 Tax=Tepidiforma sp. TaxID=2682230 RepID=UPI002ADD907F|nr:YidC/Oxa1 family membrane protein insertase [Tepidiforma sp.]
MIGELFTVGLLNPMVNLLVLLNNLLFGSFGLAIIAFTILVRVVTFPLTYRQLHVTRQMQAIQPRVQEINKKYSDPKRRQEEMMKLYREAGVNPLGCLGPMLIQFPILIALYSAVRIALPNSPEALEKLSSHVYDWAYLQHALPVQEFFLGMDLRHPNLLMVVLVGLTTWGQSKTTVTVSTDERVRQQQAMMNVMLPLMFAFFALQFPSGVSLYWVVNSIVGIGFNILIYGFKPLGIEPVFGVRTPPPPTMAAEPVPAAAAISSAPNLRTPEHGPARSKRQNRRRRNQ